MALNCKKDIRKIFELWVEEQVDAMQAVYDANSCAYELALNPRTMSEFVGEFNSNLDEVSLIPEESQLRVRCCKEVGTGGDGSSGLAKALQTELVLGAGEFDDYTIPPGQPKLTFALRDLKALLGFCEFASKRVSIHYDGAGRPIVCKMLSQAGSLQADFVLATLPDASAPGAGARSEPEPAHGPAHAPHPSQPIARNTPHQSQRTRTGAGVSQPSQAWTPTPAPIRATDSHPDQFTPAISADQGSPAPSIHPAVPEFGAPGEPSPLLAESSEDEFVEPTPPPSPLISRARSGYISSRATHQ
eukprot:TRINITY_DN15181_c0_g1_i2.p1 TRINITY_DN15181_c0_g1~~TRINITY_DN15181_c0_g1_i2.p1  ORF type:complete len:302 (+),score=32.38 TRINITY_DN15181_c0_g1_i2:383-1288(+)